MTNINISQYHLMCPVNNNNKVRTMVVNPELLFLPTKLRDGCKGHIHLFKAEPLRNPHPALLDPLAHLLPGLPLQTLSENDGHRVELVPKVAKQLDQGRPLFEFFPGFFERTLLPCLQSEEDSKEKCVWVILALPIHLHTLAPHLPEHLHDEGDVWEAL